MLTITDGGSLARVLNLPIDLRLKRLLVERRDQLGGDIAGGARFVIVQPRDSLQALETEPSFSPFGGDPSFAPEVNAGIDLYAVGKVLGHADHKSTMRYSHLANETLLAAVEAGAANMRL